MASMKEIRGAIAERAVLRAAHEYLKASAIDEAILKAYELGKDPALLMLPAARALYQKALEGDVPAIKECFDRVAGKLGSDGGKGGVTVVVNRGGYKEIGPNSSTEPPVLVGDTLLIEG